MPAITSLVMVQTGACVRSVKPWVELNISESVLRQRSRLLSEIGGIFQVPYLESTPRYITGDRYER